MDEFITKHGFTRHKNWNPVEIDDNVKPIKKILKVKDFVIVKTKPGKQRLEFEEIAEKDMKDKEWQIYCDYCAKCFKSEKGVQLHIPKCSWKKFHLELIERKNEKKCKFCYFLFSSFEELLVHTWENKNNKCFATRHPNYKPIVL